MATSCGLLTLFRMILMGLLRLLRFMIICLALCSVSFCLCAVELIDAIMCVLVWVVSWIVKRLILLDALVISTCWLSRGSVVRSVCSVVSPVMGSVAVFGSVIGFGIVVSDLIVIVICLVNVFWVSVIMCVLICGPLLLWVVLIIMFVVLEFSMVFGVMCLEWVSLRLLWLSEMWWILMSVLVVLVVGLVLL